jgi:hypothetical protein
MNSPSHGSQPSLKKCLWVRRRYELFSYQTFIFYTVVTSVVALDRVTLKKKVVDAPEILTVIGQMPHLAQVRFDAPDATRNWFENHHQPRTHLLREVMDVSESLS